MNIRALSEGLLRGDFTSADLVTVALKNIAENDSSGRCLNAIAEINPNALFIARALDKELKEKGPRSPLHGIPVVLKDNINTKDEMHTTAGSYALDDLITSQDSAVAEKLKAAGAVIVGKANLSEFAYWMSRQGMPSGFSSRCGQVVSPYKNGFDPSGSSSGSGVAAAARLVPFAIGTETDGSLTSPGRANAVTVIKPTVGLVSRTGIIPISHVQDTAGPMCTSVEDCAYVLNALQGRDEQDPATWTMEEKNYLDSCVEDISGWHMGLVTFSDRPMSEQEVIAYEKTRLVLEACGAIVEEITLDTTDLNESEVLAHEFKNGIERYLASVEGETKMRHLSDIIAFNKEHADRCLVHGQDLLEKSDALSGKLNEAEYITARARLDALVFSLLEGTLNVRNMKCLVTVTPNRLAPVSGNPVVAIPAEEIDEENPQPTSIQFIGRSFSEEVLIQAAYTVQKKLGLTSCPSWAHEFFE